MDFKQSTINEILASEQEMVARGVERYGAYYLNARAINDLLATGMVKSVDHEHYYLFVMLFAHVRKHLVLAEFSALRLHQVQAIMNMRQALEAGAGAAFALAHSDPEEFFDTDADGKLDFFRTPATKQYNWLNEHYGDDSAAIKRAKDLINWVGAHANIVMASLTSKMFPGVGGFSTPFFDIENEVWVKTDLWHVGNIALTLMHLFYGVNENLKVFVLHTTWLHKVRALADESERLKAEMLGHKRFRKFITVT
jgi:hypothetical protein